jgi:hypothetical protein
MLQACRRAAKFAAHEIFAAFFIINEPIKLYAFAMRNILKKYYSLMKDQ